MKETTPKERSTKTKETGNAPRRQKPSARLQDATKFFQVGGVAGPHALKGEVRVFPLTDDPDRFQKGLELILDTERGEELTLTVERARRNGKFVLVKFQGYDTIEAVERFTGKKLYVDRAHAIPLEEGEYYVADLIGLEIVDEEGVLLGTLTDVIETGANDVYAMKRADNGKEALIPAIKQCILNVDLDARKMTVRLLDGLLDL